MILINILSGAILEALREGPHARDERKLICRENGKSYTHDIPECLFLAGFDQLMPGYEKKESLYLVSENMRAIFSLAGIVMPRSCLTDRWPGNGKRKVINCRSRCLPRSECMVGVHGESAIKEKAEFLWADMTAIEIVGLKKWL